MSAGKSPYQGKPEAQWANVTRQLLARHPLKPETILDVATAAWQDLWHTTVGAGRAKLPLVELSIPSTVVGYFFEVIFAKELESRFRGQWRGHRAKDDKDLVYLPDVTLSVEIKTSGQTGFKVYGNRSYGQELQNQLSGKKQKSGYYITMNFVGTTMTLLRFGWIDAEDWAPQVSPTGQMAGLSNAVYTHKLVVIPGDYRKDAPVRLLQGVGPRAVSEFDSRGIRTIRELLAFNGPLPPKLERIRTATILEYEPTR
ncbi:MAG TPA: ScaI family restriction endonuclease [Pirellulales bacterium]|nr:ScaI family restriction endonuclease [Pirellulales bacterium]